MFNIEANIKPMPFPRLQKCGDGLGGDGLEVKLNFK